MPELPEVETIRRGLERSLIGKRIAAVDLREARSCTVNGAVLSRTVCGAKVIALRRRGKLLMVDLDNGISLLIHLRMTGQLIFKIDADETAGTGVAHDVVPGADFGGGYPNRSFINKLPDKSTRVIFTFSDGTHLYFNDQRKFGYIKPMSTSAVDKDSFVSSLGPEPLNAGFTAKEFAALLPKNSKRAIKASILDQSIIAGIGNIYADESLFLAGIMPDRPTNSLSSKETEKLYRAIRSCMNQSLADGGSTMRDYVDSEGLRGEYLDLHAMVFNRAGQPCKVCGTTIAKTKVAGRGTHYCPNCQS